MRTGASLVSSVGEQVPPCGVYNDHSNHRKAYETTDILYTQALEEELPGIRLNKIGEEVRQKEDLWVSAFIKGQGGDHNQKP